MMRIIIVCKLCQEYLIEEFMTYDQWFKSTIYTQIRYTVLARKLTDSLDIIVINLSNIILPNTRTLNRFVDISKLLKIHKYDRNIMDIYDTIQQALRQEFEVSSMGIHTKPASG